MRLAVAVAALVCSVSAQVPRFTDPERRAKLASAFGEMDAAMERFMKMRRAPGLAYGVVIDGELAHVKTFGVRDLSTKDPVTPDTVFRIASMTKSFTALAILKLRDAGKLSLDDPISKWIPEFKKMAYPVRDAPAITVRHLLTHSAGFPEDNPWGDQQLGVSDAELDKWLAAGIPFSTPPDSGWEYSNYGFGLLGRIVAKVSGRPYREYLEKEILAPIGMSASTLEPSAVPANARATGYRRPLASGEQKVEPSLPHGGFGAMGGLLVSSKDLARYVAFMLSAFPPRDDAETGPVRRSSVREMQRAWRHVRMGADKHGDAPLQASAVAYGYGLMVTEECRFRTIVGHGGGLPGFGSYMLWLPEYGVGLFAMANVTYASPAGALMEGLEAMWKTGALQPRKLPPAPVLTQTRDALWRLWNRWDEVEAQKIAAMNLFLDWPAEDRRAAMQKEKDAVGACAAPEEVTPENLLRGSFTMRCERGTVHIAFTLAPTQPPRVQQWNFWHVLQMNDKLRSTAESLVSALNGGGGTTEDATIRRQMRSVHEAHGACRLGQTVSSDNQSARVRLECDRGPIDLNFRTDGEGKVQSAEFPKSVDSRCSP